MKDWIPLLQSVVWPIFLSAIIILNRKWFVDLLSVIRKRIEEGSDFGIGPTGLNVGSAPRLPDDPDQEDIIDDGTGELNDQSLLERERQLEEEGKTDPLKSLQLNHRSAFWRVKNGRPYYRVIVSLEAQHESTLRQVERVVYYLHRTFKNPVREITDSSKNFVLKTSAWGEFTIHAEVFFEGRQEPLRLSRYITIQ